MSSRFPDRARTRGAWAGAMALVALAATAGVHHVRTASADPGRVLRVCADPNNLPFSNEREQGFENRLAEMMGRELHARVSYVWWAQRRGFVRNTLNEGLCDVVMGVPGSFELTGVTRPYYRSTYVFLYRKDSGISVRSLDDSVLRTLRIGVQIIGDDYANTPPAHALARRGVVGNLRGYTLYGDYREPNPPARIVDAVVDRDVDIAIVWGPLAGYFAQRAPVPLEIVPVSPQIDLPFLPFVYDIALGVKRGNDSLRVELDRALDRHQADIDRLLAEYGVPRVGVVHAASGT